MNLHKFHTELNQLQNQKALWAEQNLRVRAEALKFIAFVEEVIRASQRATANTDRDTETETATALASAAAQFKEQLEQANLQLADKTRRAIHDGLRGEALYKFLQQFTEPCPRAGQTSSPVYLDHDGLDVLIDSVLRTTTQPTRTTELEQGMIHCEYTPMRAVLDLVDHIVWQPNDIFYDLGSGMGQVPILVHLLTGVTTRGVEFEPAYHQFTQNIIQELGLAQVAFMNEDAQTADYSDGTIFFMFTPFKGDMLRVVLSRLRQEATTRAITICTFGSCTPQVAEQSWLRLADPAANHEYRLAIFRSQ